MATAREQAFARKLLAMLHEHKAQQTDPDKWNTEFEMLAVKLAHACLETVHAKRLRRREEENRKP